MGSIRKLMLGAAMVAATLGVGATQAKAAEFGFHVRGGVAYVPPCPGPGYVWVNGYYANGYWVPGYWNYPGPRVGVGVVVGGWGRGYHHGPVYARHFDRFRR
jgi:hypothetical protein